MPEQKDLELLIHGHTPILQIETHEEKRALDLLVRIATHNTIPLFQWSVTGADAANPWYFTDDTMITDTTKRVSYTYMTNPIGFDGDSDPDKTAWGTGTTALDWNIDASDNQINRTNQFLIDEYGCFFPQYRFNLSICHIDF